MEPIRQTAQETFQYASALPWLIIAAATMPLVLAAWWTKIFPSRRWVIALAVIAVVSTLNVFFPALLLAVLVLDGLLILFASIDFFLVLVMTSGGITASRSHSRTGSIGVPMESRLGVENRTAMTLVGHVRDDLPDGFRSDPMDHPLRLPPLAEFSATRQLTAFRRGAFQLHHVYLRLESPLRFWRRHVSIPVESRINVYPDMKQMSDYALLARTDRLSLIGVRRTRRIGQDSDFERLRDYTRDDNYRHIDWRSTARRRKLTVKQFQTDQSQRVVFMLDCGRMMTNLCEGLSLLDHALNASLMMAYVALHQGDSVGMLCFSDTVHAYVPPRGGASQMNRLLQAGFDQFPRMVESRYDQAFVYLQNHCKRRSLITLATNVIDEVNAAAVVDYLGNISGKHLPLGILLRDRGLFDAADTAVTRAESVGPSSLGGLATAERRTLYRGVAAADILIWRQQVLRDLEQRGVLCVDAFPDELTAPLVNQYLEIKAQHLL
ncbi:DUF58 domain-containing protein [Crateriforma conspicua]|uniref:DUF58 domain-containing protein n=1 Tax=Crateriforma conspicua TaxID=2527996 RepID=A0A5C5Y675_9PLAN|nr:DUF58 domain-containing protein [Crateriforma conspicua]TWT70438.1 hypothetical protein Pan14r_27440 [Crateriforma conspicua]